MLKLARIVRDYQDAGSVNSLLAPWGFIDDQTFLTKAGHVGLVFRLTGVDYECLDLAARRDIAHRFEASLRVLDDHYRVYQYLCKRRVGPITAASCDQPIANGAIQRRTAHLNERRADLYEVDLYLVMLYEGMGSTRGTSTRQISDNHRAVSAMCSSTSLAQTSSNELSSSGSGPSIGASRKSS